MDSVPRVGTLPTPKRAVPYAYIAPGVVPVPNSVARNPVYLGAEARAVDPTAKAVYYGAYADQTLIAETC